MLWNRFPIARIIIPFLTGIIFAIYFGFVNEIPIFYFLVLFFIYAFIIIVFHRKLTYRYRWLPGVVIFLFMLLSGYQLTVDKNFINNPNYFDRYLTKQSVVVCTLLESIQTKENSNKAIVEIAAVHNPVIFSGTSGKAILYFRKDSLSERLKLGDDIFVEGKFNKIIPPLNPGEFDYKSYLKFRSIEYSSFINTSKWKLISSGNGNGFLEFISKLRQKLLSILEKSGLEGREYGVISALLIGSTDKLDAELIKDYQGSGAMHILSVSGMHVGVIYLVLNMFLFFFDRLKYGRIPKAVILIVFVWFYATLTGLSPAVLRAATMFSFIAIGNARKYPPNILNTLVISAFVLLIINPYYLMDIGFQLSYLAVIGIIIIYPFIYKSWRANYWIVNQMWSLISLSFAAQIVTFPLCLYYFHQFPNYFLITNIAAVPLSAIVIYLGIAYLVFYSVPYLSIILAKALTYSLLGLNGSISFIEDLPYSVTRAVSISGAEMISLYLIIILIALFIFNKKPKMLIAALFMFMIFLSSTFINSFIKSKQQKIIVYHIGKHTAIDFVDGNTCYFVSDSTFISDSKKQEFHIANSRIINHTKSVKTYALQGGNSKITNHDFYKSAGFICFRGKRMVVVDKVTNNMQTLKVDYLLISNNPDVEMASLMIQYHPGLVIMDGSNTARNIAKWTKQCKQSNTPTYITKEKGAWIYEI